MSRFARVFELPPGAPRAQGRAHGEHYRGLVHELARLRTDLALAQGRFRTEDEVLATARAHLPVLAAFDEALSEELLGIAEGADLAPERVVVLNHYTDLKDIDPDRPGGDDEECSAVVAGTPEGPLLAQTWDMHGSAEPYVAMLRVPARGPAPEAWLFTLVGCLGMTGLNAAGVGVTINNLKSHDARVGVVWPALVRALLGERRATAAHHRLVTAPLSSGHHYLLADGDVALGVETSGARKATVFRARWAETPGAAFVHTNHCLGAPTEAVSWVAPTSTTRERYAWLTASLAAAEVTGPPDLWRRLGTHDGYPRSVCTHLATAGAPHAMKTCGGLLMELRPRRLHATPGCLHGATPERFPFASEAP